MAKSLQDQLMKSGLANKQQANKVKADKRKQKKQAKSQGRNNSPAEDESKKIVQQSIAAKKQKDAELNRQKLETEKTRAVLAEIADLIEANRIPKGGNEADVEFFFNDNSKVKKIYVEAQLRDRLSTGQLAIVSLGGKDKSYELVPIAVAEKIKLRDEQYVIFIPTDNSIDKDDPYADYPIPDDAW